MTPKYKILLSTFNGEKFLSDQIRTIQFQTEANWELLIRDDGSSDRTPNIIEHFCSTDSRIKRLNDTRGNVGPIRSFEILLQNAGTSPLIFFCDQDDLWHPDKLRIFGDYFTKFEQKDIPQIFHSDMELINDAGDTFSISGKSWLSFEIMNLNLGNFIAQNTVTGCLMAMNQKAKELVLPFAKNTLMHDWWCALVVSALGEIHYLNQALVKYRQHTQQASGGTGEADLIKKIQKNLKDESTLKNLMVNRFLQAKDLALHLKKIAPYSEVTTNLDSLIKSLPNTNRAQFANLCFSFGLRAQGPIRNLIFYAGLVLYRDDIVKALID